MTKAAELAKMGEVLTNSQIGGRRNMIINGDMQVAQRGTSFTSTADLYTLDRFAIGHGSPVNAMTVTQETDAPSGFKYSLKVLTGTGASASTGGYAVLRQAIEGQDMYHLNFGTSSAKTIAISFYVKSSLTGTFAVSIRNQAGNRAFASTYTINSANTWEYKTVIIAGDTSGTWATDNGIGLHVHFDLGVGSNFDIATGAWTAGSNMFGGESTVKLTETTNATWFLTGLQVEVNSQATPYEHRSFGEELALCQRYYTVIADGAIASGFCPIGVGVIYNSSTVYCTIELPREMRTSPSIEIVDATNYYQLYSNNTGDPVNDFILSKVGTSRVEFYNSSDVSRVAGHATFIRTANASAKFALIAEL